MKTHELLITIFEPSRTDTEKRKFLQGSATRILTAMYDQAEVNEVGAAHRHHLFENIVYGYGKAKNFAGLRNTKINSKARSTGSERTRQKKHCRNASRHHLHQRYHRIACCRRVIDDRHIYYSTLLDVLIQPN